MEQIETHELEAKTEKYNVDKIAELEKTIFLIMTTKRQIENLQAETNKMYEELAWDTPARLLDPQKYYYVDDEGNVQQKMHGNNVASSDSYEKLE